MQCVRRRAIMDSEATISGMMHHNRSKMHDVTTPVSGWEYAIILSGHALIMRPGESNMVEG